MRFVLRLSSLVILLLFGCQSTSSPPPTPSPTPQEATLRAGASGAAGPLLDLVIPAYMTQAPHVTLRRESGDSALLLEAVASGRDHFALVALPPEGMWAMPVAVTGVAVVVHPSNPLRALTLAQLRSLFKGEITSWAQLGSFAQNVVVLSREDGSGIRRAFESQVMGEQRVTLTAAIMPQDTAVIEAVAATPGAIGYISSASIDQRVNVVAIEGVLPSSRSLADGSYPISTPIYFVSRGEPVGEARAFLQFLLSREGQTLIGQKYGRVK
ncbi:MAG: hypothetical protein C4311_06995 [Chloroflexota bacterium]